MAEVLGVVLHRMGQLTSLRQHDAPKALKLPTGRLWLRYPRKAPGVAISMLHPAALAPICAGQGKTNLQSNALVT